MAQTRKSKPKAKRVEASTQVKAVEPKGGAARTAEEAAPPARPRAEAAAAAEDSGKAAQTAEEAEAAAAEDSGEAAQTAGEAEAAAAEVSGEAAQTAGEAEAAAAAEVSGEAAQDEARRRVAELEAELVQVKDRFLRALAETENVRRRARRDLEDALKYAIAVFAKSLLAVADNLRRALDSIPATGGGKPAGAGKKPAGAGEENELLKQLAEGVRIVERELLAAFEKHGIRKIEPLGEKFDHDFHQAMFEVEDADKPAGTIVQILEPGYLIHDRLLRPAMVALAKDKSEDTAKDKSEDTAKDKSEDDEGKSDEGAQSSQADAPAEKSI